MKEKQKSNKPILIVVFLTLLVLFYWSWMFYMTQRATEVNTYSCCEKIIDVKINFAHHRGNDKLYIITENHSYMLDTGWRNENKSYKLSKNILSTNQNCTLTVWRHFPKSLFDFKKSNVHLYQVVDLRNDTDIYWDITNHNSIQKKERTFGILGGIFLSIIVISINALVIHLRSVW